MDFLVHNIKSVILGISLITLAVVVIKNYARIKNFILEVKAELKKVSWSTKEELMLATIMVIVIMAILTVFIGVVDAAFAKALDLIIR